jgi:hypothetical protein
MKPLEPYCRKAAKMALKRLRVSKPKPRVVRTQQPQCAWWGGCSKPSMSDSAFCKRHRNWQRHRDMGVGP